MILPNLGKAWIEGREKAIERNWKDLMNFEAVEAARTKNDMANLELLAERAKFGGNMNMFQNLVDASARANEVAEHAQAGLIANANLQSMQNMDTRNAYVQYRPQAQQALYETGAAENSMKLTAARADLGKSSYLNEVGDDGNTNAFRLGRSAGEAGYNTGMAQNEVSNINSNIAAEEAQNNANARLATSAANANASQTGRDISEIQNAVALDQTKIGQAAYKIATADAAQELLHRMKDVMQDLQRARIDGNEAEAVRLNEQATRLQQVFEQTIRMHPEHLSVFADDPYFGANALFYGKKYHPNLFSQKQPEAGQPTVVQGTTDPNIGNAVSAFNRQTAAGVVPAVPAPNFIPPQSIAKAARGQQPPVANNMMPQSANLINEGTALSAKRIELLNSLLNSGNLSPAEQGEAKRQRLVLMQQLAQQMATVNGGW